MSARALRILCALALAGLWGGFLGAMHLRGTPSILDGVEATFTDMRMRLRGEKVAPDLVTIVAIDDETARQEGGYPLPRASLAQLVRTISALGPRAIALDVLLVDPGPEDGDRQLAEALAASPSVIAAAAVFSKSLQSTDDEGLFAGVPVADDVLSPLPRFAEATPIGVVNVATDRTGTPRFVPLLARSAEQVETALALQVASIATDTDPTIEAGLVSLGGADIRTDRGHLLPLAFYGPRGTIRTVSAAAVLNGELSPKDGQGRIFVIGATVTGGGDVFPSPFDPVLPGVEVVSTAITHLLAGDGLVRDVTVRRLDAGLAIALPLVLVGLLAWRRNTIGVGLIILVILATLAFNYMAFVDGVWMSLALPLAAAMPPALAFGGAELWLGRREAQHFASQSAMLQRIHAPGMAQWLAKHPDYLAAPVQQRAAIAFVDLSGFTGISESLGPAVTRGLLDTFYQVVDEEVVSCGGVITSFMGDGVMIVFGLPVPAEDDGRNAARCCLALCPRIRTWLAALPGDVGQRVGFKIGAHVGEIVASRLGRGSNQQLATTGDTVNVASRLMEVAAANGAPLAISDEMLMSANHGLFAHGRLSGPIESEIRGRTKPIAVWLWQEASREKSESD